MALAAWNSCQFVQSERKERNKLWKQQWALPFNCTLAAVVILRSVLCLTTKSAEKSKQSLLTSYPRELQQACLPLKYEEEQHPATQQYMKLQTYCEWRLEVKIINGSCLHRVVWSRTAVCHGGNDDQVATIAHTHWCASSAVNWHIWALCKPLVVVICKHVVVLFCHDRIPLFTLSPPSFFSQAPDSTPEIR